MKIEFKNGSTMKILDSEGETIRSRRYEDKMRNQIDYLRKHPSEYIFYATGQRFGLWQRIWIDKICPLLDKI